MWRLVSGCPLSQALRDKLVEERERRVNFQVLAGGVQWKNSLHHRQVLGELQELVATLWKRGGGGGISNTCNA